MISLKLRCLPHFDGLELPAYQSSGAAGMDLAAAVTEDVVIAPGQRVLIPSGLIIELPPGYEAQIRPRSGLALKHGVTVLNSPGTVDADYRGEIGIILINQGQEDFIVRRGMRVAQMVIAAVEQAQWDMQAQPGISARGAGGFGSSGL